MIQGYFMILLFGFPMMIFSWFLKPDSNFPNYTWYDRMKDRITITIPYILLPLFVYAGVLAVVNLYWSTAILVITGLLFFHGVLTYRYVGPHLEK